MEYNVTSWRKYYYNTFVLYNRLNSESKTVQYENHSNFDKLYKYNECNINAYIMIKN